MTYQLPHSLDREYQQEVFDWIKRSDKKYLILCAPTGFGKSPLAAASSTEERTLVLVLHKSLQDANYKQQYGFDILYGKSNYPCNKKKKLSGMRFTAYDCSIPYCNCPYQRQLERCANSDRVCFNYAKFLASKQIVKPDILYLDEGHNLPDIVMNFVGLTLNWDNEFAQCNGNIRPAIESRLNYNDAMSLFRAYARAVNYNKPKQQENLIKWRKWKRLSQRIDTVNKIISDSNEDWYYETTNRQLVIKPLTAKCHFKRLFDVAGKIVIMSATITPNIVERLGVRNDEFDFMEVPSVWPIPTRLVYDLGGPAINWQSNEVDKQEQARLIASVLRSDRSGIIHVMSKNETYLRGFLDRLRAELLRRSYEEDEAGDITFYIPSHNSSTEKHLQEWYRVRQPGTYCISWSFHEGVDLGADDINIMGKTPWPSLATDYEKACYEYDPQWYLEKTACTMMQLFGRYKRGIAEHYLPGRKFAYIADSSWHRLKTNLPSDFVGCIRRNCNGNG